MKLSFLVEIGRRRDE